MSYTALNYEGFEEYLLGKSTDHFGIEALMYSFEFDNGYGVSIIKHKHSYGGDKDLFELAVLYNSRVVEDTDIPPVNGWLNNEQVIDLMEQIRNLERRD